MVRGLLARRSRQRTTYRVTLNRDEIIDNAVNKIKAEQPIQPLRVQVTKAGVKLVRGGTKTEEKATRSAELAGAYSCPTSSASCRKPPRSPARRWSTC